MQIMLSAEESCDTDESSSEENEVVNENDDPVSQIYQIPVVTDLQITRRRKDFGVKQAETEIPVPPQTAAKSANVRNITAVQSLWRQHARSAADLYPKSMWRMLQAVQLESKVTQSKVLKACTTFLPGKERKEWPLSRQSVDATLAK